MIARIGTVLTSTARIGLLLAVVIASAAYGLTREATITFFNQWLGWTFAIWAAGWILRWHWPKVPRLAWLFTALILAVGWTSYGLGWVNEDLLMSTEPYPEWWDGWLLYGATDLTEAMKAMVRTSALLGGMLIATDLFSESNWARALLVAMAATVTGMVIFFFLQRSFGEPFLLRSSVNPNAILAFATYRYWGNAASFLNLFWPVLAGMAAHTILAYRARGWTVWLSLTLLVFSAVFINVSKAGNALGVVGILLLGTLFAIYLIKNRGRSGLRISAEALAATVVPIVVIAISLVAALPTERWEHLLNTEAGTDGRSVAYPYFIAMLPDASWIGFGPGNFKEVYWDYVGDDPRMATIPFWVAHQDYLQTIIEWGYLGTLGWTLLFAFPIVALIRQALGAPPVRLDQRDDYAYAWTVYLRQWWEAIPTSSSPLLAVGGLVAIALTAGHAMVDFPMQIQSLQFYFLIWIALGWHLWSTHGSPAGRKRVRKSSGNGNG